MKLQQLVGGGVIALPNDLLWSDEYSWVPPTVKETYTLTGALLLESATRQAGRPITLSPPDEEMAWVTRSTLDQLRSWASSPNVAYKLVLEYPTDTREFKVVFRNSASPIEAEPVRGFPGHDPGDYFRVTIKLMEVQ